MSQDSGFRYVACFFFVEGLSHSGRSLKTKKHVKQSKKKTVSTLTWKYSLTFFDFF